MTCEHPVRLLQGAAEGNHDDDVGQAHLFPDPFHGPALQGEPLPVAVAVVPGGPPKTQHGVVLLGLELLAADEVGVFVGFEIAHADDHRLGILGGGDLGDPPGQVVHKIFHLVLVPLGQGLNLPADPRVRHLVEMEQGQGVNFDDVVDDEFHAGQADALHRQAPPAEGRGGGGDVHHDPGPGLGEVLQVDLGFLKFQEALIDVPLVTLGPGDGDLLAVLQNFRGLPGPDNGGNAQLPADDGGVAGAPPVVRDDAPGPLHDGHPVGVRHFGDQDGVILELGNVRRRS